MVRTVHAIWHIAWADPVAALLITPLIAFEAREAMRGQGLWLLSEGISKRNQQTTADSERLLVPSCKGVFVARLNIPAESVLCG